MNELSKKQFDSLEKCEKIIERGAQTFYEVGTALKTIRDNKWYKDKYGFKTFEEYCKSKWDYKRSYAYSIIDAASVIENLSAIADKPSNESQARQLASLEPEQQAEVWEHAVATAPDGKVTAAHVEETVKEYKEEKKLEEQFELSGKPPVEGTAKFNRTNDNIEWAAWTWNPVTGCKHGCEYCYAKDIGERFSGGFEPTFKPERLCAPKNTNPDMTVPGGSNVFVCSMADLFGTWVSNEWIFKVMEQVKNNPQWTFLFLTKNPKRYQSIQFPDNAWVGTTVDTQARVETSEKYMADVDAKVKFVSCEPMLEELHFTNLKIFDWVIIGARSKTTSGEEFQPDIKWVKSLWDQAEKAKCKVYWKPNLKCRPKEYPGE